MARFRFRDEESSSTTTAVASVLIGAAAGFAAGMFIAQRFGGLNGLTTRLRRRRNGEAPDRPYAVDAENYDEFEEESQLAASGEDEDEDFNGMDGEPEDSGAPLLEERVLEAFNNDPLLSERAVDIGAVGAGIIELAGWVESDSEAQHAVTIAQGVPGVDTVVNRLMIDSEEEQLDENLRRLRNGDPALADARWEGQQVGTGRRRQGTSDEPDRHADPKPKLEDRWLTEREAMRNAADELDGPR